MKTYLIALAASAAFVSAALAAEMPNADANMQPAPATAAAPVIATEPAPAATTASTPDENAKVDAKQEATSPAPAPVATTPDDKAKTQDKPAASEKAAPAPKKLADEHHYKYHNGEGSTWKTGRNAYGFEGTYGGCQFRGHAGPDGYHIDKAC